MKDRVSWKKNQIKKRKIFVGSENFQGGQENVSHANLIIRNVWYALWKTESASHWRCSVKKDDLKNFAEFTGKHLC